MALQLFGLSGPHAGQKFDVAAGHKVGRHKVQIKLDDPKISTLHAEIVDSQDGLRIEDRDSKNGLLIEGVRVDQILLVPGTVFQIGSGTFEVREVADRVTLESFLLAAAENVPNKTRALVPLDPPLQLTFIGGLQAETVWWVGYGPRACGKTSLDLTLHEPDAPDTCFELLPTPRGLTLTTQHGKLVRVNGESHTSCVLKKGDVITVLNSKIEVDILT